jgi:predicted secreted protein
MLRTQTRSGAAGFRAVSQGTGTVSLAYRRPWEKDVAPAQTFKLTLVVK